MDKNRISYLSFMNVIAAVSVVILHADSSFWFYKNNPFWPVANVIDSLFYFAVPLFFMMTGVTLIDYRKRYTTKEYFKKRFFKTVIPFLFWSVFAMLWQSRKILWAMITGAAHERLNWTVVSVIDGIVNTKFLDIYWFFIPLFCIYLAIPLLALIPEQKRVRCFTYIIAVSVVLNYAIPFGLSVAGHYGNLSIEWPHKFYYGFEYMIYPLIGYVLHKAELRLRFRLLIYAAAIAGLVTMIVGTYFASAEKNMVDYLLYKGYYRLPCLLYASGVFLFLKHAALRIKSVKVNRFFAYFQKYTFPVYLIHRYYLDVIAENISLIQVKKESMLYVVIATVLALGLSVLTTMLLRKIPVLRHIVP